MATGYVVEWRDVAIFNNGVIQAPRGLPKNVQVVDFTAGTEATDDPIDGSTGLVGLFVDAAATFVGGASPAADVDDCPLGAEQWFFYVPEPGTTHKIAFYARS